MAFELSLLVSELRAKRLPSSAFGLGWREHSGEEARQLCDGTDTGNGLDGYTNMSGFVMGWKMALGLAWYSWHD